LVVRPSDTKTSVKEGETSPMAVIGKWLPSTVWILRFSKYSLTLVREAALFVIWLEVVESKYQGDDVERFLPKSPKAENAKMIICWIMAGVTNWTGVGALCLRGEEPIETIYVVSVFLGGRIRHSLMICPSFLQ